MENYSPTPTKPVMKSPTKPSTNPSVYPSSPKMNFSDAVKKIIEGHKIHKLEWEDKEFYGFMNGEFLSLHKPDGNNYKWIVSEGDLTGTDYVII